MTYKHETPERIAKLPMWVRVALARREAKRNRVMSALEDMTTTMRFMMIKHPGLLCGEQLVTLDRYTMLAETGDAPFTPATLT